MTSLDFFMLYLLGGSTLGSFFLILADHEFKKEDPATCARMRLFLLPAIAILWPLVTLGCIIVIPFGIFFKIRELWNKAFPKINGL